MTLLAASFFSFTSDTFHFLLPVIACCVIAPLLPRGLPVNTRWMVYTVFFPATYTVLSNQFIKIDQSRWVVTPSDFISPLTLLMAAMLTLLQQRRHVPFAFLACIFTSFAFSANVESSSMRFERIGAFLPSPDFLRYFGCKAQWTDSRSLMCILIIHMLPLFPAWRIVVRSSLGVDQETGRNGLWEAGRSIVQTLCLAAMIFCTPAVIDKVLPWVRSIDTKILNSSNSNTQMKAFDENPQVDFMNESQDQLDRELMRIEGAEENEYLRARIYNLYEDGGWRSSKTVSESVKSSPGGSSFSTYRRYRLAAGEARRSMEFYPSSDFHFTHLPLPAQCKLLDIAGDNLSSSEKGVFQISGFTQDAGYHCQAGQVQESVDSDPPGPDDLQMPATEVHWRTEAAKILGDRSTLAECAPLLVEWFSRNCSYSTSMGEAQRREFPEDSIRISGVLNFFEGGKTEAEKMMAEQARRMIEEARRIQEDRSLHFLRTVRKGHCEMFASSTVMLLRSQGIPARYVTGIVCGESYGNFCICRRRDLHAWVQAWDEASQSWYYVETTPAAAFEGARKKPSRSLWEDFKHRLDKLKADIFRGRIADIIAAIASKAAAGLVWCFSDPWRALLSLLVVGLFSWWLLRGVIRRWRERLADPAGTKAHHAALLAQKALGGPRREATLGELAKQARDAGLDGAEDFYRRVEDWQYCRYSGRSTPEESLAAAKALDAAASKLRLAIKKQGKNPPA
jgi:hypothetical protein